MYGLLGLGLGVLASVAGFYGAGLSAVGLIVTATSTVLGTASAVGTLAVARKAGSQTLPAGSEDLTDVGLTTKEKRELLGSGR